MASALVVNWRGVVLLVASGLLLPLVASVWGPTPDKRDDGCPPVQGSHGRREASQPRWAFSAPFALLGEGLTETGSEDDLYVTTTCSKTVNAVGAGIFLQVTLLNVGSSTVVLPARNWAPNSTITFEVVRDGEVLGPSQYHFDFGAVSDPCEFVVLHPNEFYGVNVEITERKWKMGLDRPGKYTLRTRFTVNAILGKAIWEQARKACSAGSADYAWIGTVCSDPVEISLYQPS